MSTPRILLVDDDRSLLEALPHTITLRIHGVSIDTATSALQALDLLQGNEYDAILSDVKMPGMDGLELLTRIHDIRPDIPTLLITGHGDQTLITQALREGAYDFIQKPIDRVYLVAALHRAIHTRQLRRLVQQQRHELEQYAQSLEQLVEQRTRAFLAANDAMEILVRDALDLSMVESRALVLHRSRCNLVEVCQQVLDAYSTEAGRAIDFDMDKEPVEVEIDRERISQVLIHLIFHARSSSRGDFPIQVTLERTNDEAIVMVREMMREEMTEHPLARFYDRPQAEARAQVNFDGGLGFFLSQHIVAKHEGRIEIHNSPEMGISFSLILPLAPQDSEKTFAPFEPPQWMIS